MRLIALASLAAASLAFVSGCSICAPGYLDDYGASGGKWQRTDPANGRVGSVFSDPNAMSAMGGTYVDSGLPLNETHYDYGYEGAEAYSESDMNYADPATDGSSQYDYGVLNESLESSDEVIEGGSIILGDEW